MDAAGEVDVGRRRLGPQHRDHLGRDLDPVDIDALRQEVEQQPTRPAADIEDGLTQLADQIEVEATVVPPGRVAAQRIPGSRLEPRVLEIGGHRRQPSVSFRSSGPSGSGARGRSLTLIVVVPFAA